MRSAGVGALSEFEEYTQELLVTVPDDVEWDDPWEVGERLTGYGPVDELLLAYELDVTLRGHVLDNLYEVSSPRPVNTFALARKWLDIPGVIYTAPHPDSDLHGRGDEPRIGLRSSIRPDPRIHEWRMHYSVGWGGGSHDFVFTVGRSGGATLEDHWGDPP